jgi:hypothetical protein
MKDISLFYGLSDVSNHIIIARNVTPYPPLAEVSRCEIGTEVDNGIQYVHSLPPEAVS